MLSAVQSRSKPIVLRTTMDSPPVHITVATGLGGTAVQLLQHLRTSLQVGRLNRAEAIINRLRDTVPIGSPEFLYAHAAYLEEKLRQLCLHGRGEEGRKVLQEMQKWFDMEICGKDVAVDAKILVIMIRASIRALDGALRDRTVRRYADMGQALGDDYDEVLESEDYDDNEFTLLGHVTSQSFVERPECEGLHEESVTLAETSAPTTSPRETLSADEIPEVMATPQKGDSLRNIKSAMAEFGKFPSLPMETLSEDRRARDMQREHILEETCVEVAVERWRKADEELRKIGVNTAMQTKDMGATMWQWYQTLLPCLETELAECKEVLKKRITKARSADDRYQYGPYLELLPLEKIAANTILFTLSTLASSKEGLKLSNITHNLADTIEQECTQTFAKKRRSAKSQVAADDTLAKRLEGKAHGKKLSPAESRRQALLAQLEWPNAIKLKLGAMLVSKLIECAHIPVTRLHPRTKEKVTQIQPAFLHYNIYTKGKKSGILAANAALTKKLKKEPLGSLIAKRMPMVVAPIPWTGWKEGAYLHFSTPIMRLPQGDKSGRDYFMAAHLNGDTQQLFAGLDVLSKVPWKIQRRVFEVQVRAWNTGDAIANLAPLHPKFDVPPEPSPSADPQDRRKWVRAMRNIENRRAALHSQRCYQNLQLQMAKFMVNETMYFPHNVDFRGRAYPIPPYLNHTGPDNVRGMLVFAKGKELGDRGLRWLKIHLATVAGHDKASMEERVEFTMNHLDDIYDSVRRPLDGRRWWLESEDAWQTLAACFELTEALDSPDPTRFVSHLPIQQDGTCNGLQHYAALGGDEVGAQQVNLEPGTRPMDVYTAVAERVKAAVREEAANGDPIAMVIDGRLTRKWVKQPVMTNVYGVTFFGAKEQVRKQLHTLFSQPHVPRDMSSHRIALYVATRIFMALGSMFRGAQAIQRWLGVCAERISLSVAPEQIGPGVPVPTSKMKSLSGPKRHRALKRQRQMKEAGFGTEMSNLRLRDEANPMFKSAVVWTTPLRMPVIQPYRTPPPSCVRTKIQDIGIVDPAVWHPVNKRKQVSAFPPNFIHSLDATHMLLSALKCDEAGLTFASVHDSFWTHASDVDQMGDILRDAFVTIHKDNVIARLREEFQTRYKGFMYLQAVTVDNPAGQQIVKLRKSRRASPNDERSIEAERLRLLASESAEERARGAAMITPGSIAASMFNEAAAVQAAETAQQTLGVIPGDIETSILSDEPEMEPDMVTPGQNVTPDAAGKHATSDQAGDDVSEDECVREDEAAPRIARAKPVRRKQVRKVHVWLPLTFPEVPPKGDFDVERLRDSTYFFH